MQPHNKFKEETEEEKRIRKFFADREKRRDEENIDLRPFFKKIMFKDASDEPKFTLEMAMIINIIFQALVGDEYEFIIGYLKWILICVIAKLLIVTPLVKIFSWIDPAWEYSTTLAITVWLITTLTIAYYIINFFQGF